MKQYRPTLLYAIKIFGLIVCAGFGVFIISVFLNIVSFFIASSIFEKIITVVLIALFIISAFLIIRSNNPGITTYEDYINIGNQDIPYNLIQSFYPAKGGSEPYVITTDGEKIDLEISWLSKKDRIEIEKTILENIKPLTKQV
ncbi:hypothetical protein D1815_18465 [Aquimarina sp. AD1]|uniref:hypothetical protein n=1 Tax=Aquimarina TaxID=290174 RepID=UPI0003F83720|nr:MULTISPECIES: hypothetical protein [Aquimarina]AXT57638.1 hypothetical protein D1815_18465 [Aquimarina sp. AD1]RKN29030.1 hypothetical protein D7035_07290 [Aquimarina sp. AD1]